LKHIDLANAHEIEFDLTYELEAEFEDGMEHEDFLEVDDMHYLP
jgi:hypothetical protein